MVLLSESLTSNGTGEPQLSFIYLAVWAIIPRKPHWVQNNSFSGNAFHTVSEYSFPQKTGVARHRMCKDLTG